jgi:uncharacterized membrane protein
MGDNKHKLYIGAIQDEYDAARQYDRIAILEHGLNVSQQLNLKAKTNWNYNKDEIVKLLEEELTSPVL